MSEYQLKAKSFKKMEDPVNKEGHIKYVCYVKANSIPDDLENWMSTNPREQKMTTNVAKSIQASLEEKPDFHELNRGILMSVEEVTFDTKDGTVTIEMDDPDKHGNIDGGHTLRAVLNAKNKGTLSNERYVFLSFLQELNRRLNLLQLEIRQCRLI
ncbi:AIPR family protein [Syntrophomonas palmitatica]|uniref:AIPR family protein n=1 Tax=Syntrophomonas palmitatica TaxID=402877 RepID=UPI0006D02DF6|nr:AIPR family protein [Syntrophomonas palmitatica]